MRSRPRRGCDVYRHHVFESLGTALAATFPTVLALVGDGFLPRPRARLRRQRAAAAAGAEPSTARIFPPSSPATHAARDLPYLADVARLDWALNLAFHAPPGGRLKAADLAAVPVRAPAVDDDRLAAGAVLVSSRYP
mgnify:CR=1 FL=1